MHKERTGSQIRYVGMALNSNVSSSERFEKRKCFGLPFRCSPWVERRCQSVVQRPAYATNCCVAQLTVADAAEQHDEVRVEFCPQHSEHEREHSLLIMDATSEVYIVSLLKKAIETEHLTRMMEKVLEEAELCGALCLAGRKMKEFPSVLSTKYDLSDLVSLDLSGNRLSDVPACVCESRSLESLRLRDNILRSIPLNIFYLRSLTVLDLSNNKIVHLPLSLFELPLEIVLLNGNRLDSIPHEIRQLSSTLAELDLSCNLLRSIPVDIALLKMLRVLNLRRNLLEQFPSELCRLSLHTLDLSCNRLKHLPPHIGKMGSLVEFHMRHNPLQFPPADLIVKIVVENNCCLQQLYNKILSVLAICSTCPFASIPL
ncbi:hypothetical protein RB195_023870 [Necator americanus]|uniref:Leucine Rich repeat-containing domain protein n=1 Tax=Necator americanus TaxID=51031 RepID=A0ABR1EKX0_NECAM